jgi:mannose-6-phosphate isomerase-like protein (cupin superfamily)
MSEPPFVTVIPNAEPDAIAPDGSEVRLLGGLRGGTMASFTLPAGACSAPIKHRTVEELWVVISGAGQMWRKQDGREEIVDLKPGMGLSIPLGTHFQFRAADDTAFVAVGVTMPPWPGHDEAIPVEGPWEL